MKYADLKAAFHFPDTNESGFISSVYEEEQKQSGSTFILRVTAPIAALLLLWGMICLLTPNMPLIRDSFSKIMILPGLLLAAAAVFEILKRIHLSNIIKSIKNGSFMLAEVKYVSKRQAKGYYKEFSFNKYRYYITVSDNDGNLFEFRTGKAVFINAGYEENLFVIKLMSGRGYWNVMDLYSGVAGSLLGAISCRKQ